MVPMSKDLGWPIGEIAAPTGLRLVLFGLSHPFAARLMTVAAGVSRNFIGSYIPSFLFAIITSFLTAANFSFVKIRHLKATF